MERCDEVDQGSKEKRGKAYCGTCCGVRSFSLAMELVMILRLALFGG